LMVGKQIRGNPPLVLSLVASGLSKLLEFTSASKKLLQAFQVV